MSMIHTAVGGVAAGLGSLGCFYKTGESIHKAVKGETSSSYFQQGLNKVLGETENKTSQTARKCVEGALYATVGVALMSLAVCNLAPDDSFIPSSWNFFSPLPEGNLTTSNSTGLKNPIVEDPLPEVQNPVNKSGDPVPTLSQNETETSGFLSNFFCNTFNVSCPEKKPEAPPEEPQIPPRPESGLGFNAIYGTGNAISFVLENIGNFTSLATEWAPDLGVGQSVSENYEGIKGRVTSFFEGLEDSSVLSPVTQSVAGLTGLSIFGHIVPLGRMIDKAAAIFHATFPRFRLKTY